MELYLLKSAVILTVLYGFYKLVLENESMHIFKRFYLLGSLPAAFLIPLVTFTRYVEVQVTSDPVFIDSSPIMAAPEVSINPWPFVLWGLYAFGGVFFSIKFGKNLNQLISKIKNNPKFTRNSINHILLKTPIVPHTFLNYVFLNKQKFEAREIPDEVIAHEHVHAKQRHSIDILIVEFLQIVFWFNPLLYLIKRSIKLNHEFLADRAVLNLGTDRAVYQNLLLAFSSSAVTPVLANSINYSFIKKRFTVMKKQTSTRAIWLRSLLVLPLLAILLYGFSDKITIQKNISSTAIEHIKIHINKDENFTLNGYNTSLQTMEEQLKKINPHLSNEEQKKSVIVYIYAEATTKMGFITDVREKLTELGFQQFVSDSFENESDNTEKNESNPWSITPSESGFTIENQNSTQQQKATLAEVEEYNKLARKYNNMSRDKVHIITAEIDRMKFIYGKMTAQQKENAEPFPYELPIPSKIPPAPDRLKLDKMSPPPAPPVPIVPPTSSKLIKLIEEMAENDASFYMDNKKITLEEAYKIAQSQKFNSISSTVCDNQKPILTFSKNFVPAPNDLKLAKEVLEKGGELYLNDKKINFNEFKNKLEQIRSSKQDYTVNLEKGDNGKDRLRITIQE